MRNQVTCKAFFAGAVTMAAALVLSAPSPATMLLKLSVEKMSVEAEVIITGEVSGVQSAWSSDQTTIYTTTTIKVAECIAGSCADTMVLKHRGGTVGDKTLFIAGMPEFKQGQKVLLFLRRDPEGQEDAWAVIGMCQGTFFVEKDAKDGKLYAQQQGGAALAAPGPAGTISILEDQKPVRILLGKLIARIKKARAAAKAAKAGEGK